MKIYLVDTPKYLLLITDALLISTMYLQNVNIFYGELKKKSVHFGWKKKKKKKKKKKHDMKIIIKCFTVLIDHYQTQKHA